jgi:hypothetical protein
MTHGVPSEQGSLLDSAPGQWPADMDATGDAGVDRLLAGELQELPDQPVDQHNATYLRLHDGLLGELESD